MLCVTPIYLLIFVQHVRFHRLECCRVIRKSLRPKVRLQSLQQLRALFLAPTLHRHALFRIRRARRRSLEIRAPQTPQPGQRLPTKLVNHPTITRRRRSLSPQPPPSTQTANAWRSSENPSPETQKSSSAQPPKCPDPPAPQSASSRISWRNPCPAAPSTPSRSPAALYPR